VQVDVGFVGAYRARSAPTHVQRNRPLARQCQRAADVVAVFVGDENGVETFDARAEARQAALDFFCREAAVEQYARGGRAALHLNEQSIAFTAASQAGEPHGPP
jgi:hypothetical protein